jgi:predicted negative regulator of RcsB-dependent stress response
MSYKKVSRKELLKEPDKIEVAYGRMLEMINQYRRPVAWIGGLVLVVIFAASAYRYFDQKSEAAAFTSLATGKAHYQDLLAADGPEAAFKAVENEFKTLLASYGGKEGAKLARLSYAEMAYQAQAYDTAIDQYQQAEKEISDQRLRVNVIYRGLGYAYLKKNDLAGATKYFEMIVGDPTGLLKDEALFNLADIYAATGNAEKSQEALQTIISDHSDSIYATIAKERVAI